MDLVRGRGYHRGRRESRVTRARGHASYPMSAGRNFDEILRIIDSLQLSAKYKVATTANWKDGDDVIILTSVSNEEAQKQYPAGFKTIKPFLRVVPQPRG